MCGNALPLALRLLVGNGTCLVVPGPSHPQHEENITHHQKGKDGELGGIRSGYSDPSWLVRRNTRKKLVEREGLEVQ